MVMDYYSNYPHLMREDILHTQEVVSYTRMIAIGEGLSAEEVDMQEIAAWLHDIGCPLSKEIHGNSLPVNQQRVGREVARQLLEDVDELTFEDKLWLENVVGTHHEFKMSKLYNFTPLFEADLIANMLSGYYNEEQAERLAKNAIISATGMRLYETIVCNAKFVQTSATKQKPSS